MRKLRLMILAGATAALFGGATLVNATHTAQGVSHVTVAGNPSCSVGTLHLKIEPVVSGTYGPIAIVVSGSSFSWEIIDSALNTWDSNVVIVKGGPNAEVYTYPTDPATGLNFYDDDSGLTAPTNPKTGRPYGISHIEFCLDPKA